MSTSVHSSRHSDRTLRGRASRDRHWPSRRPRKDLVCQRVPTRTISAALLEKFHSGTFRRRLGTECGSSVPFIGQNRVGDSGHRTSVCHSMSESSGRRPSYRKDGGFGSSGFRRKTKCVLVACGLLMHVTVRLPRFHLLACSLEHAPAP